MILVGGLLHELRHALTCKTSMISRDIFPRREKKSILLTAMNTFAILKRGKEKNPLPHPPLTLHRSRALTIL